MDITATTRRAYQLINAGDLDGFGDLVAHDFVEHDETAGFSPNKQGVLDLFHMFRAAFPDLQLHAEEVLVSDDKTVTRARATGTHQGELMGMPPTGRSADVKFIDIHQYDSDGRMCGHWGVIDMLSMMQQLGAIPQTPAALGHRTRQPAAGSGQSRSSAVAISSARPARAARRQGCPHGRSVADETWPQSHLARRPR